MMESNWNEQKEYLATMPKIELHCHLDGSLGIELTQKLLAQRGEEWSKEKLTYALQAPMDCESLAEYLKRFDLPNRVLQTPAELQAAAFDVAEQAARERVLYIEVRFAPLFSTAEGMKIGDILEAVQAGLDAAKYTYGIASGILVCGMRGVSMDKNLKMLREAREFFGKGVVGCDLAGDEKAYPAADFEEYFTLAKTLGLPFTIHAGECQSVKNIRDSIDFGAKRIGHGIAMAADAELRKLCANRRIGVELCPTSNLQTKALTNFSEYPFEAFYQAGIPLSINTDNRSVSNTTCTQEYLRLAQRFSLTEEMCRRIYVDSIETSFASDEIKHRLLLKQ